MNSRHLEWTPRARRDLNRLDPATRSRIVSAVVRFAETNLGDVVKLSGKDPAEYRLRVGAWRIRFAWDQASRALTVLHVFKRGQGYE